MTGRMSLEVADAMRLAPREEMPDGLRRRRAGVPVADVRGEELDEAPRSTLAGAGDRDWQSLQGRLGRAGGG